MKKIRSEKTMKPGRAIAANEKVSLLTVALFLLVLDMLAAAAYTRNGIYKNHVTLWASVTKSSPGKRRAHENYGQALSTAGSLSRSPAEAKKYYDEALRQFETVLALKDDGSVPMRDLYREIGVVYFRTERYNEAINVWQTGLRHAPFDPSLLNNLSIVLMQQGRIDEAAAHAQQALTVDPTMPQALNTMGQVSMMKKDYANAVQYFLRAIEREPDVAARYWNAALALDQAGKNELALQYANRYVTMEQDPVGRQRAAGFIAYVQRKMGKQ